MAQAREKVKLDLDNIEQLFGLVEMQQRLGLGESDARNSTVYLIAKTLQLMIERGRPRQGIQFSAHPSKKESAALLRNLELPQSPYDPDKNTLDLYDYFARLIGGQFDQPGRRTHRKDVVITFNYDLVLDHALMRAGFPISYHLPPEYVSIPAANNKEGFALLKLHGSTNWGICSKCKRHIMVSFDKMTSDPGIFRNMECRECQKTAFQPMLVPPSWDKTEYQDLMRPIWNRAVIELQRATRICIIGYSLPESDAYFKYLLTLGLAENHGLYKLIVVDKASVTDFVNEGNPSIEKSMTLHGRYTELLEDLFQERRFSFHNEGFWQWLTRGSIFEELGRGEMIVNN
jgi:hypothetical protein